MADKYPFLADEWFGAVQQIIEEHDGEDTAPRPNLVLNMVVTDTPFGNDREFHIGSQDDGALFGQGHQDEADVTLTTDYATAIDIFVSGNPQAGMQAFMAGKVKVQGDMTKLMMAGQGGGAPGGNATMTEAIQAVTATE